MKRAIAALVFLSLLNSVAVADNSTNLVFGSAAPSPQDESSGTSTQHTSFRGLTLGASVFEILAILHRDFPTSSFWWSNNSLEMWSTPVHMPALVRFDKSEHASKFEFTPDFFGANGMHPRDFADAVFKHYGVEQIQDPDESCFSQSTCFKGVTRAGEFLLILTITGEVQFHVSGEPK